MPEQAIVKRLAEGRTVVFISGIYRFLVTGDESSGRYAQWELIVPPGNSPPLHVHSHESESFFVTEGEISFQIEDQQFVAPTGTSINVPAGVRHTFRNDTAAEGRMLITVAPAGLEHFFFEIGAEIAPGSRPLQQEKLEMTRLIEVCTRYGIEILMP